MSDRLSFIFLEKYVTGVGRKITGVMFGFCSVVCIKFLERTGILFFYNYVMILCYNILALAFSMGADPQQ